MKPTQLLVATTGQSKYSKIFQISSSVFKKLVNFFFFSVKNTTTLVSEQRISVPSLSLL